MKKQLEKDLKTIEVKIQKISEDQLKVIKGGSIITEDLIDV